MTLDSSELRKRVRDRFPDAEQVEHEILRFTKRFDGHPYAVYYLDFSDALPMNPEALARYQDRVIGSRYFDGETSLQWSTYLYFVLSGGDERQARVLDEARRLIESDRAYARKYVIGGQDLDMVLGESRVPVAAATRPISVLSKWTARLATARLEAAILSDANLPDRLRLIESPPTEAIIPRATTRPEDLSQPRPFIRNLRLENFRSFPRQREFRFGRVNLISGANGTGKTSLLEAIELFYCGRNKRNPNDSQDYRIEADYADGTNESATSKRLPQRFRDRNLAWYGVSEVRTNNLFQSFGLFNFLDTDAAVSLADSTSQIQEDLSKLLVGPDASKTWKTMERVLEALKIALKGLRPRTQQAELDLTALRAQRKEAAGVRLESDSARDGLGAALERNGWVKTLPRRGDSPERLLSALAELMTLVQLALNFDWVESPVSIDTMAHYVKNTKALIKKIRPTIASIAKLQETQSRFSTVQERHQEGAELAREMTQILRAEIPRRNDEREARRSLLATYSNQLAGLDPEQLTRLVGASDPGVRVNAHHEAAKSSQASAQSALEEAAVEFSNFSEVRDRSESLAQELRHVASRILKDSSTPDKCPLCHTVFDPGELEKHLQEGLDERLERLAQSLKQRVQESEDALNEAALVAGVFGWLRGFCDRAGLDAQLPLADVLTELETTRKGLAETEVRLRTVESELLSLESQGLSLKRLSEVLIRLEVLGFAVEEASEVTAAKLLKSLENEMSATAADLAEAAVEEASLQERVRASLFLAEVPDGDLERGVSDRIERITSTEGVVSRLGEVQAELPWRAERPLSDLLIEATSVRSLATSLQGLLQKETLAGSVYADSRKREVKLERQLAELKPRLERFIEAETTLESIRQTDSLDEAMDSVLEENRESIEAIFARIHSPAEFSGIGSKWNQLVRKPDGALVSLSEISNGQRAAYALSVFLAQNRQLKLAPPTILIDDPIAHLDDLNSLSFLDYLREVVLLGERQVFFATASDKLASLFERKFDFLGEEDFQRYDLKREP